MNWQSFSQLAFGFHLTPAIVAATLGFSVVMGLVGGFLPSVRAARVGDRRLDEGGIIGVRLQLS
jgi:hypothetical protein